MAVQRAVRVHKPHTEEAVSDGAVLAIPQKQAKVDQGSQVPEPLPVPPQGIGHKRRTLSRRLVILVRGHVGMRLGKRVRRDNRAQRI